MVNYFDYPDKERIFYVCLIVENICRKTDNTKQDAANYLGTQSLQQLYNTANTQLYDKCTFTAEDYALINNITDAYIADCRIQQGSYAYSKATDGSVPSLSTMGNVYARLAAGITDYENTGIITALCHMYHSFICNGIDSYSLMFFLDHPEDLLDHYKNGYISAFVGMSDEEVSRIAKLEEYQKAEDELGHPIPLPSGIKSAKDTASAVRKKNDRHTINYYSFPDQEKIFYVCLIVETICRKTSNTKQAAADCLGMKGLQDLYNAKDTEQSKEMISNTADKCISTYSIRQGNFAYADDTGYISGVCYDVMPSAYTMSRVYGRLAAGAAAYENTDLITALYNVYHSYICGKLDNYDIRFCFDTPEHLLEYYKDGYISAYAGLSDKETAKIARFSEWKMVQEKMGHPVPLPAYLAAD